MKTMNMHWGWRIGIVYSVFALATLGFVGFALTQDVDLVRSDYYEYSLAHDEHMASQINAKALGATLQVEVSNNVLHITIPVEQANDAVGTVTLYRASSTTSDKEFNLKVDSTGLMSIPLQTLASGKWTVTCSWKYGDTLYEIVKNVEVG